MDIPVYQREAWNCEVSAGNPWTKPVSADDVAAARQGNWRILLTPTKSVPVDWFGRIAGKRILCLASGGGQQGPILAAVGADVTVLDNSPAQLAQDTLVSERDRLEICVELGQMNDLSRFRDHSFDLIVHPVSNLFTPDVRPVWRECFRVLDRGGALLSGFANPAMYIFDLDEIQRSNLVVRNSLPYSDAASRSPESLSRYLETGEPLEFGHTLDDQIGGQIDAGFVIAGFYEDRWPDHLLDRYMPTFMATRGIKA